MGRRPDVETASLPITALDTLLLSQQLTVALARVPFRRPLHGRSSRLSNLGQNVTREVLRSFMGYVTSLPVPEFRSIEQMLDDLCRVVMPPVVNLRGIDHTATQIGSVPGILYVPRTGEPRGVILYLHGGGYIGTSPAMYSFFTSRIAAATGCAMFVADYRLAPEFPFPAGLEDAARVLAALEAAGLPRERIFLAGDSGGGGLANSLVLAARTTPDITVPAGLVLFSPEVDLGLDEPSVSENAPLDILPWNIPTAPYLNGTNPSSGYVSSMNADLHGFPPTAISWGGDEMFRDPIRTFVARLRDAEVDVHAHEVAGMFHVFQILMPWAEESRSIYEHVRIFVDRLLVDAPQVPEDTLRLFRSGWSSTPS